MPSNSWERTSEETVTDPEQPEQVAEESAETSLAGSLGSLMQRLGAAAGTIRIVGEKPGVGEMTNSELYLFDPEGDPSSDMASVALITALGRGGLGELQFMREMVDSDDDMGRARHTLDNMVRGGVLRIEDGKVYANFEMVR